MWVGEILGRAVEGLLYLGFGSFLLPIGLDLGTGTLSGQVMD